MNRFIARKLLEISMEKILGFALLVILLAVGVSNAEIPNLLGNWTGSWSGYDEGNGHLISWQGSIDLNVTEQKDRTFAGNLTLRYENETSSEGFAGAIGTDNKWFYLSEFDKGYAFGTIISGDRLGYIYLSDGGNGSVAIDELQRVPK
jgi:hypothetical protein